MYVGGREKGDRSGGDEEEGRLARVTLLIIRHKHTRTHAHTYSYCVYPVGSKKKEYGWDACVCYVEHRKAARTG